MIRPFYSKILLVIVFLAVALMLSSFQVYVGTVDKPTDSSSLLSGATQTAFPLAWTEAQAKKPEHYCVGHCSQEYKERLAECKNKKHEHHKDCKKWAKDRERECLQECYREHPK